MPNYFLSYDLNVVNPTHADIDKALSVTGSARTRILETVWWVKHPGNLKDLELELGGLVGPNDSLVIIEAAHCAHRNLLGGDTQFARAWNNPR